MPHRSNYINSEKRRTSDKRSNECSTCNLPCEQVFLEQNISYERSTIRITTTITNISGRDLRFPLVLVSSILGNKVLTANGMAAGTTRKITQTYNVTKSDVMDGFISNVSFVARGVPTSNGSYTPGERISPVQSEKIVNEFIVWIDAYITRSDPYSDGTVTITVTNIKPANVIDLVVNIDDIWENAGSPVKLESGSEYFIIDSNKRLTLKEGVIIPVGKTYTAVVYLVFKKTCQTCQTGADCLMNYYVANTSYSVNKAIEVQPTPP